MRRFESVLVANRGEIACRIIDSAQRLGLATIALYSEADRGARHVRLADRAHLLGPAPARDSYLDAERVLRIALESGAGAVHPGYGFLSENAAFAAAVEEAGLVFVGPTPTQLSLFGQKHTAREAAASAGVALLPGSGLLGNADEALAAARLAGYPVILKATGGGGGIGMRVCTDPAELTSALEAVERVAGASFGHSGVYLEHFVERARHVEVQLFGDGEGAIVLLGDRDCSLQRRNQKVVEESPAPALPDRVRAEIAAAARALGERSCYRSAGTVEFVYDPAGERAYFLEVNTRLQVEHPVTEACFGIDLVEWMLRLAAGERDFLATLTAPSGHAIEARLYAEDPQASFLPSSGLLTEVVLPEGVRVDTYVEAGTEVSTYYDPLLAKIVAHAPTRELARERLIEAIASTRVGGVATNLGLLGAALREPAFIAAEHATSTLETLTDPTARIEIVAPGAQTTVQSLPGRLGYWSVGVPPSGPMDDRSFAAGNALLGNEPGAAGLEIVLEGPTLRFVTAARCCVTGAPVEVRLDDAVVANWQSFTVTAGSTLSVGAIVGPGMRAYLLVAGGLDLPEYLGSSATFTLGGFGGHQGRALRAGDVLRPAALGATPAASPHLARLDPPEFPSNWRLEVLEGPHAAPEFFTEEDLDTFYGASWTVHFNSARTGVRLSGPTLSFARPDGGEAGLHPSNIHDTPYAVATIDFTGDTPIILGPDGPSLGGFVCPATVILAERWKLGQLRPGDTVTFVPVTEARARARRLERARAREEQRLDVDSPARPGRDGNGGVLHRRLAGADTPEVTYRRAGDDHLLVEYGPMTLDLALRLRIQSLQEALTKRPTDGVLDVTAGIRSLQLHLDPNRCDLAAALEHCEALEEELPPTSALRVPSRRIHLPLSFDDPATREAIARYMAGVRDDAPWCPWNIEFIRRINGLASTEQVRELCFAAEYLVLGLGDVYLGAPVATPVDPRHRLVTTKYNPARTWTPENAVGIGGAYLCIYGMEGPGGYQFVGRTVQVWRRYPTRPPFEAGRPWLLRHFDRICWYPVDAEELLELRADMAAGRLEIAIEQGEFSLAEHREFLATNRPSITAFQQLQQQCFAEERERWRASGEFERAVEAPPPLAAPPLPDLPTGARLVTAPLAASVWQVEARTGARVEAGDVLLRLEAMKLEVSVAAPSGGVVGEVLVRPGQQVAAGQSLCIIVGAR